MGIRFFPQGHLQIWTDYWTWVTSYTGVKYFKNWYGSSSVQNVNYTKSLNTKCQELKYHAPNLKLPVPPNPCSQLSHCLTSWSTGPVSSFLTNNNISIQPFQKKSQFVTDVRTEYPKAAFTSCSTGCLSRKTPTSFHCTPRNRQKAQTLTPPPP